MPGALILLPPAVLVVGGLLSWAVPPRVLPPRIPGAVATWAALAALIGTWFAVGQLPTTVGVVLRAVTLPPLLQLDATRFAAGVILLAGVGVLVTVRGGGTSVCALGTLATACAQLAVEAGSLALLAVSVGAACLLLTAAHREEGGRLFGGLWAALVLAILSLLAAAAIVLALAGTTVYTAIPVTAFSAIPFLLVVMAAACLTGLFPWPTWVSKSLRRARQDAAGMTLMLLTPLGLFLLLETTQLGAGVWPAGALHVIVALWSAFTLAAAGMRAQAAGSRREALREVAQMQVAVAAIALSLGTQLGIAAGVTGIAAATLAQLISLLLPTSGRVGILGGALAVAVPPGLAFCSLALTAEAGMQAGPAAPLLVLVLGVTWVLGLAAVGRASGLPVMHDGSTVGGVLVVTLSLAGGALLGFFELAVALPAAAAAIPNPNAPPSVTVTAGDVVAASGGWGALALGALALVFVLLLPLTTRALRSEPAPERAPAPFLAVPAPTPADGLRWVAGRLRLRPSGWDRALERMQIASERGPIWLWAAIGFVLAIVVTR
jgi:hypothetical protein